MGFDLEKFKMKLKRKLERCTSRITEYENNKENLSIHGHWSLGYHVGVKSEIENFLDEIEELETSVMVEIMPPNPEHIQKMIRISNNNPNLNDSGLMALGDYQFELDGCMDWSGVYIKKKIPKMGPHGIDYDIKRVYRARKGANNGWKWDAEWLNLDIEERSKVVNLINEYYFQTYLEIIKEER